MSVAAEVMFNAGFDQDATAWLALLFPAPVSADPVLIKGWIEGEVWHKGGFGLSLGWRPDAQELLMIRAEIEQDRETAPAGNAGYQFSVYPPEAVPNADKAFAWLDQACADAEIIFSDEAELSPQMREAHESMTRDQFAFQKKCSALPPPLIRAITEAYLKAHPEEKGEIDSRKAVSRAIHDIASVPIDDLMRSRFADLARTVLNPASGQDHLSALNAASQEKPHRAALRAALQDCGVDMNKLVISPELDLAIKQTIALADLYAADMQEVSGSEPTQLVDYRGMLSPTRRIATEDVVRRVAEICCSWRSQLPVAALADALIEMRHAQAWRLAQDEGLSFNFCDVFLEHPSWPISDLIEEAKEVAKKQLSEPENQSLSF